MLSFQIVIPAPFMTLDEYSRHSGMPKRTLKDWAAQGKLILKKKDLPKETPLVNMVAMQELATREALSYLG
ncbi:hypothetical protein [uncultured Aliivibrio sp.]|uniref:hypothetical protein n=1 Tax=uncultured Aliivibrio sp. TaxID=873085 RepID=UPI002615CDE1|nr:hypothetical protein [uncultured Aliivibrio sp.]